jgi:hypothetical protein
MLSYVGLFSPKENGNPCVVWPNVYAKEILPSALWRMKTLGLVERQSGERAS